MTALAVGKSALKGLNHVMGNDKPHSSISDWVDILSSARYQDEDYEGIPELVESINLQPSGPTEACRAIRKKLKYGDVHRQLRSVTILKAIVENSGTKFQSVLQHDPLLERIKITATESMTDERVRKKLMAVLGGWHRQYKDDGRMAIIAGLWQACGGGSQKKPAPRPAPSVDTAEREQKLQELKEKAEREARERADRKEKERLDKEAAKRKEKEARDQKLQPKTKRKPFNFEEEKPKVLISISSASQASNNLINALKLVNREKESIETNARVQECLAEAKAARKTVVRYIQLVTDENYIGTLIDSNERVITALELYDHMLKSADQDSDDEAHASTAPSPSSPDDHLTAQLQKMQITGASVSSGLGESQLGKLQDKQRIAIERAKYTSSSGANPYAYSQESSHLHPDLRDLTFGSSNAQLPPPIQPNAEFESEQAGHGSLSDFSDYDSSEEDAHQGRGHHAASSSAAHNSLNTSNPYYQQSTSHVQSERLIDLDDPFADPFSGGDQEPDVGTPGITHHKQYVY